MPPLQQHVIRRQSLRAEVRGSESDGFALQRRLSELCHGEVSAALDRVLAQFVPADEHWVFDRLDIDAGTIALDRLDRDFAEALADALARKLSERPRPDLERLLCTMRSKPPLQSVHEALSHFLGTGSLPWWFHLPAGKTLEQVVLESWQTQPPGSAGTARVARPIAQGITQNIADAIGSSVARARLVRQFSARFLTALLERISPPSAGALAEVFAALGVLGA